MIRRLNKIVRKDFDELSDEDKVYRFCEENEYPIGWYSPAYSSETTTHISSLKKKVRNL